MQQQRRSQNNSSREESDKIQTVNNLENTVCEEMVLFIRNNLFSSLKILRILTEGLVLVRRHMKVSELKKYPRIHIINQKEGYRHASHSHSFVHIHILMFKRRDFIPYPRKLSESMKYGVEISKIKNRRHTRNFR